MFPWWERAFALGAAASSPGRTENQGARRPSFTSRHCEGTTSSCVGQEADKHKQRLLPLSRLLETSLRAGVWPDSVQVLGGTLASRLPARSRVWLYSGLRTAGHRGAVWLKRGVPGSQ
jgi:hypothetical protein